MALDEPPLHRKFPHPDGGEVEFYVNTSTGRYVTVTGDRVEGAPDALNPIGLLVAKLWAEVDTAPASQGFDLDAGLGQRVRSADFQSLPQWVQDYISHGGTGDRSGDFQAAVNHL